MSGSNLPKVPEHRKPRNYDEVIEEVVYDKDALDVVFVANRRVACMGSGGALGHPKVFYTISEKGFVECGYCDRVFVFDPLRAQQG